jgi:phosphoribosyl 1,2-cyclic phosphodiesterase
MSLELCILASGSMGNCTVLRSPAGIMLIDCGLGPRVTAGRMKEAGVLAADIKAICLTHLDRDHFNLNWVRFLIDRGIAVHCHENRIDELCRAVSNPNFTILVRPFNGSSFQALGGIQFSAIPLAHDAEGSHGFLIEGFGNRVGFATDLGNVPETLIARFGGCDIIGLESNYDPQMQRDSGRPWFLQKRITGGKGHLSNEQALLAIQKILDRSRRLPRHIVLLHRSQQCNCAKLVAELFSRDPRIAPRLTLADQYRPTPWLHAGERAAFLGAQLDLAFG